MEALNSIKKFKYHIFIGFNILWVWSLLSPNIYYLDDIYRSAGGYYHWGGDYRPFADYIYYFLGLGYRLTDLSPFPQVLALIFIYTVLFLYVKNFSKENFFLIHYIIFLPIVFNPFMLSNLYFKFDSVFMMLSILLSVISIFFVDKKSYFKAAFLLYISSGLYQPSLVAYVCTSLFFIFKLIEDNKDNKDNKDIFIIWLKKSFQYFLVLLVSVILYYFTVIKFTNDVNFYSLGHTRYSVVNIKNNIILVLNEVSVIFESDTGSLFFSLMGIAFLMSFFYFFKKISYFGVLVFLIINFVFLLSLISINILLEKPRIEYRIMISFGFFVSFLLYASFLFLEKKYKYVFNFLSFCVLYYFFSISLNVSNAQKIKDYYESPMLHNLSDDLYELGVNSSFSYLSSGSINISSLNQIYYKYPIVKKIVKNDFFYIRKIQNYFPYPLNGVKRFNSIEENDIFFTTVVKDYDKVKDRRMYNIYMNEKEVLIFFKEKPNEQP